MTLFHCAWSERVSILVDAENEEDAIAMATELGDARPEKVRVLPVGAFACSVEVDEEDPDVDEDGDAVATSLGIDAYLDPFPHTAEVLKVYEDTADGPACEAIAQLRSDDGPTSIQCSRPKGHTGGHEAIADSGEVFEW